MKSIKPGRAPSLMGGVMSLLVGLFGIVWTGRRVCVGRRRVRALWRDLRDHRHRAGRVPLQKRCGEKPLFRIRHHRRARGAGPAFGALRRAGTDAQQGASAAPEGSAPGSLFCPYCGAPAALDYAFCKRCGKRLPD